MIRAAPLTAALLLSAPTAPVLAQDEPARPLEPSRPDETVHVLRVSKPDEPELFDVVAHLARAADVLDKLASESGRDLRIEAGEAVFDAGTPVDVHLRRRPLAECVEWIAGAAGLRAEVTRSTLRVRHDRSDDLAPEAALQRAIDGWRASLVRDPLHPDASRLRFQIGNAYFQLGEIERQKTGGGTAEFNSAIAAWRELENRADPRARKAGEGDPAGLAGTEFGDLPLVYYRCGFAYQLVGAESEAQDQWLTIVEKYADSPFVADARLQVVKSYRRQGDQPNANLMLRLVVEGQANLSPKNLIDAGELLNEGNSHERAATALEMALRSTSDPALQERGGVALARSKAGLRDWHGVVATAERYVCQGVAGRHAAEMWLLLGEAHHHLDDPFTALLAIRRSRELHPGDELAVAADLLEGRVYADCGMLDRADLPLERAGESSWPRLAAPALLLRAQLLRDDGQLEAAARVCTRLRTLPGHEIEAAVALARIFLLQRNRTRCIALVRETLPLAEGAARDELNAIAAEALRDTPTGSALDALIDAPAAAPAAAPAQEAADGR